ncbi:TldD/PmbA family protein [bacterium]|nr:TldD/PmbA family protein [bacterium]
MRVIDRKYESLSSKNSKSIVVNSTLDQGFGIRVIADHCWGFSSSMKLDKKEIAKVAKEAVEIAKSGRMLKRVIDLTDSKIFNVNWKLPYDIDPFKIPQGEKISYLKELDDIMLSVSGVRLAYSTMKFKKEKKYYLSSEGSYIEQEFIISGGGIRALATSQDDMQYRTYPKGLPGSYQGRGYETINDYDFKSNAKRIAEEAVALLDADPCPVDVMDIILTNEQLAFQIHESVGHPAELDRVFGFEANWAGFTFLTPEKLKTYRFGSPEVNLVADATAPHGMGTYAFDDEGVEAQGFHIVKDGIFTGYLSSRETAPLIDQSISHGTARACGWNRIPIIRMSNINLLPGKWDFNELIADTKQGILMDTNKSFSIDHFRMNFQFETEIGWEIKSGKKTRMLKNPVYQGITPEFWNSCDGICSEKYWTMGGTMNCGKGEPEQIIEVGHGTAPARFRKVKVGLR